MNNNVVTNEGMEKVNENLNNIEVEETEDTVLEKTEESESGSEENPNFVPREQVFEQAKENFPELSEIWKIVEEKELLFKEIRIRVFQPFKQISNFIVLKQVAIVFKVGKKKFSPYKLYGQLLYKDGTYYNRIIWMKGNRFLTKQDMKADTNQMSLITNLLNVFCMSGSVDFSFPF